MCYVCNKNCFTFWLNKVYVLDYLCFSLIQATPSQKLPRIIKRTEICIIELHNDKGKDCFKTIADTV